MSISQATQEIESTFDEVQKVSPETVAPFFRYPYLSSSKATVDYLRSRNIGQFAIDVDSLDWRFHNPKDVIRKVMTGLKRRGRGIILMHDIHKSTADALPELLVQIKAAGFKVVHIKPKSQVQLISDVAPPVTRPNFESVVRKFKQQRIAMRVKRRTAGDSSSEKIW